MLGDLELSLPASVKLSGMISVVSENAPQRSETVRVVDSRAKGEVALENIARLLE